MLLECFDITTANEPVTYPILKKIHIQRLRDFPIGKTPPGKVHHSLFKNVPILEFGFHLSVRFAANICFLQ